LTAAHCVDYPTTPGELTAIIGRTNLLATDGETRNISEIRIHPQWNGVSHGYDVALLKLASSSTRPLIRLAFTSNRDLWGPGDDVEGIGRGALLAGGPGSNVLRKVTVPIVADDMMAQFYGDRFDPALMLGAGITPRDSCQGDSGGPLFATSL